jgi:hypothetical protein
MFCLLEIYIVLALDQRSDLRVWCVSNMNSLNTNELPYIYRGKSCNKIDVYGTQADEKTVAKPYSRLVSEQSCFLDIIFICANIVSMTATAVSEKFC